jgi:hypothetical protein
MGQVYLVVWRRFFQGFARRKMGCGGVAFLLGIFEFLVCFVMVNRGEFVVDCVVNVVSLLSLFRGLKMGQLFELYFWIGASRGARKANQRSCISGIFP